MSFSRTAHPEIVRVESDEAVEGAQLVATLDELARLAEQNEPDTLLRVLEDVIPGAAVRSAPPPDLTSVV